jgi:glycosyltransferase involved in cell wall biosynthesis
LASLRLKFNFFQDISNMPESATQAKVATRPPSPTPWRHTATQAAAERGVFFQGIVYGGTGYAEEAWVVAVALAEAGIPVQLATIGAQSDFKRLLPPYARQSLERLSRQTVDMQRSIFYQHAMTRLWNPGIYGSLRVGRTMFETDRIPDGWVERCNALDEVWVPTEFNRATFAESGVEAGKLRVVSAGVDTELFRPDARPLNIPHLRSFNFLSVFDVQPRKGSDLLLKAYLSEFKPDEDVALILKLSQHSDRMIDPEAQLSYFIEREVGLQLEDCPPIIVLNGFLPQQDMASLYARADAFVLPTHGEGYGRPLMEALSSELPVIATRWSGQLSFLRNENSYLIDIEGLVPASVEEEIFAGHLWAQPSVEHLRKLMREVFSKPADAKKRAQQGRRDMVEHWDWGVRAPLWVNEFRRILD